MTAFLQSPWVALLVLGVLLLEAIVLLGLWHKAGQGLRPGQTIAFLGAGCAFALSLYIALSGGSGVLLGACLSAAFVFHVWDLLQRWQR